MVTVKGVMYRHPNIKVWLYKLHSKQENVLCLLLGKLLLSYSAEDLSHFSAVLQLGTC